MKKFKAIAVILFLICYSDDLKAQQLGQINDPDGYTNVRSGKSTNDPISFKILKDEYFYYELSDSERWLFVTNMDGKSGFIHKSRVEPVKQITFYGKTYQTKDINLKIRIKTLGKTTVKLTQLHNKDGVYSPFHPCTAYIEIQTEDDEYQLLTFENIEGMGGHGGVTFMENKIPDHLILTKEGNYNGRSIIITKSGKVFDTFGGEITKLLDNRYLVLFGSCDIGSCGFAVYDIEQQKILAEKDEYIFAVKGSGKNIYLIITPDFTEENQEIKQLDPATGILSPTTINLEQVDY